MELLLLLLSAHFIGDFYLQPFSWVKSRNVNHIKSTGLWLHFITHALLYSAVLLLSPYSLLQAIAAVSIISISHLATDLWKSYQKNNLFYFLIDQAIHILIISMVWAYLSGFTLEQIIFFSKNLLTAKTMIIAMAYILVCKPASISISIALKKHTDDIEKKGDLGLISAGSWIGYIERCLAISFIFIGQFAGIGFLVAAKTIFRFGDLTKNKDMQLTEYMMIGTLLSYAIALFVGWNALLIYQAL